MEGNTAIDSSVGTYDVIHLSCVMLMILSSSTLHKKGMFDPIERISLAKAYASVAEKIQGERSSRVTKIQGQESGWNGME